MKQYSLRAALSVCVCVAILLVSSAVFANSAAISRTADTLEGPHAASPTPLVIEREQLSFQCTHRANVPVCTFEARYHVHNPTEQMQRVTAAFYGLRAQEVRVRSAQGSVEEHTLDATEQQALDRAVLTAEQTGANEHPWMHASTELSRTGFTLALGAGERTIFVATGTMNPHQRFIPTDGLLNGTQTRHPLLYRSFGERTFDFEYLLAPIRTWGAVGPIELTVRFPHSWRFQGRLGQARELHNPEPGNLATFVRTVQGDTEQATMTIPNSPPARLAMSFVTPAFPLQHGGPYIGIGGNPTDTSPFRMRFGYEFAGPAYMLYGLAFDTDFTRRLLIAPSIEFSLPWIPVLFFLPSVGAGLGIPIQLLPQPQAGLRFQLTATYPVVGFTASFDLFPSGNESAPINLQTTLLARISL